jgi:hypothetical protein
MGSGRIFYVCKCGGEITEEWDHLTGYIECSECNNPNPESVVEEFELEIKEKAEMPV